MVHRKHKKQATQITSECSQASVRLQNHIHVFREVIVPNSLQGHNSYSWSCLRGHYNSIQIFIVSMICKYFFFWVIPPAIDFALKLQKIF